MSTLSPDALIAPWLTDRQPVRVWVIGSSIPPVVQDYAAAHAVEIALLPSHRVSDLSLAAPDAALVADPITEPEALESLGILRNRLVQDIFCLVSTAIPVEDLFALSFSRGQPCVSQSGELLSFHYTLATYNHTRVWNNPKFWANPENWNKYWW